MPPIQQKRRRPLRSSERWVKSRQPHMAIVNTRATAARPNNCINKSAIAAPGKPKRLLASALVAWEKLGSLTDQVASAIANNPQSAIRAIPEPSRRRRLMVSRNSSVNTVKLSIERSIIDMTPAVST